MLNDDCVDYLSDERLYTFDIEVTTGPNLPPIYDSGTISYDPIIVALNQIKTVPIPSYHDPEGQ